MIYERISYMCPKCNQISMYDNAKEFSTICANCNIEMVCIGKKFVSSEEEERRQRQLNAIPIVCCPYCGSVNTKKITSGSKIVHTVMFGIFSLGRNSKQWHCNNCKSDF